MIKFEKKEKNIFSIKKTLRIIFEFEFDFLLEQKKSLVIVKMLRDCDFMFDTQSINQIYLKAFGMESWLKHFNF